MTRHQSPCLRGLPQPIGERDPAAQSQTLDALRGLDTLTRGGQGLRVPGCSTLPRSSQDFLGVPSQDFAILGPSGPCVASFPPGPKVCQAFQFLVLSLAPACAQRRVLSPGPEWGRRPGSQRRLSVTPQARRTWGRAEPATSHWRREREPRGLWRIGFSPFLEG